MKVIAVSMQGVLLPELLLSRCTRVAKMLRGKFTFPEIISPMKGHLTGPSHTGQVFKC